jgi:hypothetical protein
MTNKLMMGSVASLMLAAGAANGQVVINEVYENPPGSGSTNDAVLEFIELYGKPGMDLTGYAVGLFKGGSDVNGDDIPSVAADVEIDEAFSLDGLTIGDNGFLVLYNGTTAQSLIPLVLPAEGENSASFFDTFITNPNDTLGSLSNDDSSTYLLVRRRPGHSISNGMSVYGMEYSMWKDSGIDVDYDGKLDYGIEVPVGIAPLPLKIDPLQIIDEIAWSNNGGKEYVRSSEQEISDTTGFNPDAVSRLAYYGENPMLGQRINSDMETVPTRTADESWIYGDCTGSSLDMTYDDTRYGAPTDQSGDGFMDIAITSGSDTFKLTPGTFNDHSATGITQFRFVDGDLNFDGVVDAADLALFDSTLFGADLDATEDFIDPDTEMAIPDPENPGSNLQSYVFQGRLANAYLAAACLSDLDGVDVPGSDDRDALAGIIGTVCPADFTGEGDLNFLDVSAFLTAFGNQDPSADFTGEGQYNFLDVSAFLTAFGNGCP